MEEGRKGKEGRKEGICNKGVRPPTSEKKNPRLECTCQPAMRATRCQDMFSFLDSEKRPNEMQAPLRVSMPGWLEVNKENVLLNSVLGVTSKTEICYNPLFFPTQKNTAVPFELCIWSVNEEIQCFFWDATKATSWLTDCLGFEEANYIPSGSSENMLLWEVTYAPLKFLSIDS